MNAVLEDVMERNRMECGKAHGVAVWACSDCDEEDGKQEKTVAFRKPVLYKRGRASRTKKREHGMRIGWYTESLSKPNTPSCIHNTL